MPVTTKRKVQHSILGLLNQYPKEEIYTIIAKKFHLSRKQVSFYYLDLMRRPDNTTNSDINDIPPSNLSDSQIKKIMKQEGDNLSVSLTLDYEVRTLEALLAASEVDSKRWQVISWQCKKWEVGIKNASNAIETKQLFSVGAKFKQKNLDTDPAQQKDVILKELFEQAPRHDLSNSRGYVVGEFEKSPNKTKEKCLLELALFDLHFGKLAHREECGADYDIKIAAKRYTDAIDDLLSRVDLSTIERILLPIGNDMINIDNTQGTTTAGTPQDSDSRFYKIVRTVKELLIKTIDNLLFIAPVDVVVVAGNHDQETSFMIGEMLDAYYHNSQKATVFNSASLRKYYGYGKVSIMFTHGNKEKHANLGMIFAAENPKLWASSTQRYVQLGHYHSNKKIQYIVNEELQGFQIQILPSLSGNDAWTSGKGFNSLRQAKSFLFNKSQGLIGEFTHSV